MSQLRTRLPSLFLSYVTSSPLAEDTVLQRFRVLRTPLILWRLVFPASLAKGARDSRYPSRNKNLNEARASRLNAITRATWRCERRKKKESRENRALISVRSLDDAFQLLNTPWHKCKYTGTHRVQRYARLNCNKVRTNVYFAHFRIELGVFFNTILIFYN